MEARFQPWMASCAATLVITRDERTLSNYSKSERRLDCVDFQSSTNYSRYNDESFLDMRIGKTRERST